MTAPRIAFRSYHDTMELIVYEKGDTSPECLVIGLTPLQVANLLGQMAPALRDWMQARDGSG